MPPRPTAIFVFALATLCVASLMWMTWEVWRISVFAFRQSDILPRMDGSDTMEQQIVLVEIHPVGLQVLAFEGAVGALFLILLYRLLFPAGKVAPS